MTDHFFSISHRAIKVLYDPAMEKFGNYVSSLLAERYDALIFLNETEALHPIKRRSEIKKLPETYPFGY